MFTTLQKPIAVAPGKTVRIGDHRYRAAEVINPRTRPSRLPFIYEKYRHPKVRALARDFDLPGIIAGAGTDLERGVRIKQWVWERIVSPQARRPRDRNAARPALAEKNNRLYGWPLPLCDMDTRRILECVRPGRHTIYCSHAAWAFMEIASALGLFARKINISGHGVADLWCHELRQWVLFDPLMNFHYERAGCPISIREVREELFRNAGRDVRKVVGAWEKVHGPNEPADLPVSTKPAGFEWFHILSRNDTISNPINLNDYWDNARYLILRDRHNRGKEWWLKRKKPYVRHEGHLGKFLFSNEPDDLFWDVGLSEIRLTPSPLPDHVRATIVGFAPNLRARQVRRDGGRWQALTGSFQFVDWRLHSGENCLEARAVYENGLAAPESAIRLVRVD